LIKTTKDTKITKILKKLRKILFISQIFFVSFVIFVVNYFVVLDKIFEIPFRVRSIYVNPPSL